MSIEHIARAAHEVNRAYCIAIGDSSQVAWDDAPEWQRQSAIDGVCIALLPDSTPEKQHEAWCEAKTRDGWTHGAVKDPAAKTHPCLVAYAELPEAQRKKDLLYITTVRAMAAAIGVAAHPLG